MDTITEVRKLLTSLRKNFHCTICLDLLSQPISTKCNHQFCSGCFKELLSKSSRRNPSKCPLCKTGVTKRSVNPNPNLEDIVSSVWDVCQAADDDCENIGGTPLLSQRVRVPSTKNDIIESRTKKKCLSFVSLVDEEETVNFDKVNDKVSGSRGQTRSGNKSSNLRNKADFFSKRPRNDSKAKRCASVITDHQAETNKDTGNASCDNAKENVHPRRSPSNLPSVDISSSLDAFDKDALIKINNSQNNLVNRLKKRQKLKEIPDVVFEQPDRQEVIQKRKSDEIHEETNDICDGIKKKKRHNRNLCSDQTGKENKFKTSETHGAHQIDSKNLKPNITGETEKEYNAILHDIVVHRKEYTPSNRVIACDINNVDHVESGGSSEVPQSVSTVSTASPKLPSVAFNAQVIHINCKSSDDFPATLCTPQEISNNTNEKSNELHRETNDICGGIKEMNKLNLCSNQTEKEKKFTTSGIQGVNQIDFGTSKSSKLVISGEREKEYVISNDIAAQHKKHYTTDDHGKTCVKNVENTEPGGSSEVPQSVSTVNTTPPCLSNNLKGICIDSKSIDDIQHTPYLREIVGNNSNDLHVESCSASNNRHSDVVSPSPCGNKLNKSLTRNNDVGISNAKIYRNGDNESNQNELSKLIELSPVNKSLKCSQTEPHEQDFSEIEKGNEVGSISGSAELFKSEANRVCENQLDGIPSNDVMCASGTSDVCKVVSECESSTENRITSTPDTSAKNPEKTSDDHLTLPNYKSNDPKINNSQVTLPRTPTGSNLEKDIPMDSPSSISTFIKFPKTPKASQIVKIEKDSDLMHLLKNTTSPNRDLLLFGNLSFSKVNLPNRRDSKSFRSCRRSFGSNRYSLCSELSGENNVDNSNNVDSPSVINNDKHELSATNTQQTQESNLSISNKINKKRKSMRRNRSAENKTVDVNVDDTEEEPRQEDDKEREKYEDNTHSCTGTTQDSGLSANSKINTRRKTKKRKDTPVHVKMTSEMETGQIDVSTPNLLTDTSQESNSSVDNKLMKNKTSTNKKSLRKKASKSVKYDEIERHENDIEAVCEENQVDLPISYSRGDMVELQTDQDNSQKSQVAIAKESCISDEIKQDEDMVGHTNTDSDKKSSKGLGSKSHIIISTNDDVNISDKEEDIVLQPETEDFGDNSVMECNTDTAFEVTNCEVLNQSVNKHSEELIPPTPPISAILSKINITTNFKRIKNIIRNDVITEEQVEIIPCEENAINQNITSNLTKKDIHNTDNAKKSALSEIGTKKMYISKDLSETYKNCIQSEKHRLKMENSTSKEDSFVEEELTCSDEAFFADVDKYESEKNVRSKYIKQSKCPTSLGNNYSQEQSEREEGILHKNKSLIRDLDSSFTCTDKLLCNEGLGVSYTLDETNDHGQHTINREEEMLHCYDTTGTVRISNPDINIKDLEADDIHVYTDTMVSNNDCETEYTECFLDSEELSVSILTTTTDHRAPAEKSDILYGNEDKTIAYVRGRSTPANDDDNEDDCEEPGSKSNVHYGDKEETIAYLKEKNTLISDDEDETVIEEIMYVKGEDMSLEEKDDASKCSVNKGRKKESNDISSSLQQEFLSSKQTQFQNIYECNDFEESEKVEVDLGAASAGKKFRQLLKTMITEESEESMPAPSQNSVDFSIHDKLQSQRCPQVELEPSEEEYKSHPRNCLVMKMDGDAHSNNLHGREFHNVKIKRECIQGDMDKEVQHSNMSLSSEVKKFIQNEENNENSADQFVMKKKRNALKLQKTVQGTKSLNKSKLNKSTNEDNEYKVPDKEVIKRETSVRMSEKYIQRSKNNPNRSCKESFRELSSAGNIDYESFNETLIQDDDESEGEDQLFSPLTAKKLCKGNSILKSPRYPVNTSDTKEDCLISNNDSRTVRRENDNVNEIGDNEEILLEHSQMYMNSKCEGVKLGSAKKIGNVDATSSSSMLSGKNCDFYEQYTSPPKVKRLSDENIASVLKNIQSATLTSPENVTDIVKNETMLTEIEENKPVRDSVEAVKCVKSSASNKRFSQRHKYPFDDNLFSPASPFGQYKAKDGNLSGPSRRGNFMYKDKHTEQKLFSPPNSKKLLNESVVYHTPKPKYTKTSPTNSKDKTMKDCINKNMLTPCSTVKRTHSIANNSSNQKTFTPTKTKTPPEHDMKQQNIKYNTTQKEGHDNDNKKEQKLHKELLSSTPLKPNIIPIAQSTAYRQQCAAQDYKFSPENNAKSNVQTNNQRDVPVTEGRPSKMPKQSRRIVDDLCTPRQKISPVSTANTSSDYVTQSNVPTAQRTPKLHENINIQRLDMHSIQDEKSGNNSGNNQMKKVSPKTPLKTEFVPVAQSTAYRKQYLSAERNVKISQKNVSNEIKTSATNNQKGVVAPTSRNDDVITARQDITQKPCLSVEKPHTTTADIDDRNMTGVRSQRRSPVIMTSRLSKKYMMYCYSSCQSLGGKVVQNYSGDVTHLIVLADENNTLSKMSYTYKYLVALASGHWIVTIKWVVDSVQKGKFLEEEKYEAKGDPVAHHTNIPRLFRTASETKRRCIFENYRVYVVGTFQQSQINREQLFMLLQKCGADVIFSNNEVSCSSSQVETVLLTDNLGQLSAEDVELCNKSYLRPIHPDWVVESIINFRVEDTMLYVLRSSEE